MADFECTTYPGKNRMYLRLSGFFKEADATELLKKLDATLDDLEPGFDVVTDLSKFVPTTPSVASALRDGAERIKARGRRRAVRIASRLVTGLLQFKRELKGVFAEGTTRYARSKAEAERMLDEWEE